MSAEQHASSGSGSPPITVSEARPGDWIVSEFPGNSPRRGMIAAAYGKSPHRHFDVRWTDSHGSLFFPEPRHTTIIRPRAQPTGPAEASGH
jgi:hypothetical protein